MEEVKEGEVVSPEEPPAEPSVEPEVVEEVKPEEVKEPELSEAEKKEVEQMTQLKTIIEKLVNELYTSDLPVGMIEVYADDAFSKYRRMKTSQSAQWDEYIKEKTTSENKFFQLKCNELADNIKS